jgi:hypothetical protein
MLIAFTAPKQSGKDTCADYLVEKYGYIKVSFAKPLKDILKILFMFTDEQLYGSEKEISDSRWFGCTPRTTMQYIGTELIRKQLDVIMPGMGEDYFVYYFKLWYEKQLQLNPHVKIVLADLRNFENEINIVKHFNGLIVKIERPDLNVNDHHESEIPIRNFDYLITNNQDLPHLHNKVDQLMTLLNVKPI